MQTLDDTDKNLLKLVIAPLLNAQATSEEPATAFFPAITYSRFHENDPLEGAYAILGGWLIPGEILSTRSLLGCALMPPAMISSQNSVLRNPAHITVPEGSCPQTVMDCTRRSREQYLELK